MKIIHKISIRPTGKQSQALEELGVKLPVGIGSTGEAVLYVTFEVDESHPKWEALARLFREWDVGDYVSTIFSDDEVASANWLNVSPAWHHGYPQPEEDFEFLRITYDLVEYCGKCGLGKKQKAPFRMKGEPKWGRRGILQLNWVFDEFFVKPEVWYGILRPRGIDCRPVVNEKGSQLETIVQLVVTDKIGIETDELTPNRCTKCGRVKYLPFTRGFFPALTELPITPIARTKEAFGSGARAFNEVIISQALARALTVAGVRGAEFIPVADARIYARVP